MKIHNYDLVGIVNTLEYFSKKKLPQKISYAITRNLMVLSGDIECYTKSLNKIIDNYKDYILKDESGNIQISDQGVPNVDKDHIEDYGKEIGELLKIEFDVDLYLVDISVFDYDDSERYDVLSAIDILQLQSVLCSNGKTTFSEENTE